MKTKVFKSGIMNLLKKYGVHLGLVMMVVVTAAVSDVFLTPNNLINVFRQVSINGILAVGMTIIIIAGGIDLSVGSILGFVGYFLAITLHLGVIPAILIALAIGGFLGLINGLLITKLAIPPFIATLGTMVMHRGMLAVLTKGYPIVPVKNLYFKNIGSGYLGPIPIPIIIVVIIFVFFGWIMKNTKSGRYIYAVGSNEEASRCSGIKVDNVRLMVYVVAGVLYAVAAIILTSRLYSTGPLTGSGYELDAIAAPVIGGTSFMGGEGTIPNTGVGVLILGMLQNIFNLLGIRADYQGVFKGLIIIVAVGLDTSLKKIKGGL